VDASDWYVFGNARLHAGLALTVTRFLIVLGCLAWPAVAGAQQLNLTTRPLIVTFPTADPDTAPVLSASPVTVQYRVRGNGNRPWLLTVQALGDLVSGPSRIPASSVSWTATPAPPFRAGSMSSTQAQTLAAGNGNVNPTTAGLVTFQLANSWTYDAGTYLQTITFTLSTP
jgi:hypothetical protein